MKIKKWLDINKKNGSCVIYTDAICVIYTDAICVISYAPLFGVFVCLLCFLIPQAPLPSCLPCNF